VIVDDSLASARAFGGRLRLHGIPVFSIPEGDITALWLEHLRPLWASGPVPVAGLTTPATLFCLEQLAWQHRLRVTFHAEHVMQSGAGIEHTVQRDSHSRRLTAAALRRAGGRWPQRLADALATQRVQNTPRPGPSLAALQPTLPAGAKLLTSWIIA
jgi:hypothetical protein